MVPVLESEDEGHVEGHHLPGRLLRVDHDQQMVGAGNPAWWQPEGEKYWNIFPTQIRGIPTPADINLQLGNVVKMGDGGMDDEEALDFKKKIMRYVHLRLA